jgi:hypothetical protein
VTAPGGHDLITSYHVYRAVLIVIISMLMLYVGYWMFREALDSLRIIIVQLGSLL